MQGNQDNKLKENELRANVLRAKTMGAVGGLSNGASRQDINGYNEVLGATDEYNEAMDAMFPGHSDEEADNIIAGYDKVKRGNGRPLPKGNTIQHTVPKDNKQANQVIIDPKEWRYNELVPPQYRFANKTALSAGDLAALGKKIAIDGTELVFNKKTSQLDLKYTAGQGNAVDKNFNFQPLAILKLKGLIDDKNNFELPTYSPEPCVVISKGKSYTKVRLADLGKMEDNFFDLVKQVRQATDNKNKNFGLKDLSQLYEYFCLSVISFLSTDKIQGMKDTPDSFLGIFLNPSIRFAHVGFDQYPANQAVLFDRIVGRLQKEDKVINKEESISPSSLDVSKPEFGVNSKLVFPQAEQNPPVCVVTSNLFENLSGIVKSNWQKKPSKVQPKKEDLTMSGFQRRLDEIESVLPEECDVGDCGDEGNVARNILNHHGLNAKPNKPLFQPVEQPRQNNNQAEQVSVGCNWFNWW